MVKRKDYHFKKGHKINLGKKNTLGYKHSQKTKQKIGKASKGRKFSEETRKKMSKARKGKVGNNKGKHWKLNKKYLGKNHWAWKGGKNRNKHVGTKYIKWRLMVFQRDNYTCQGCKGVGGYLEVHHIKSWTKYPKLRYNIDNGITLCLDCHKLTNNYKNRNVL